MMNRLGLISWATGTVMLAAVSACGGSDTDPPPTSAPSSTSPSSPTTSSSPSSPSDAASGAATDAVRSYFAAVDQLRSDPAVDLKKLKSVATSAQLNAVETLISRQRDEGQRQTGTTALMELKVQSVNLDNSDPKAGKVPTVVIDVCWDVSKVDVLDKSGQSIVSPDRPDTGWTRYTVANYKYAADPTGGWRVATGQDLKQTPCAAS
ncbi:hypothetical protein EKO23_16015 [Nocardioides guangzhouensis]|uniref:Secreted protein/lipoprotein n=1 Tax=Nocardioides guangzhouensis TaxID=2497878 RepID=A0A4Q4Z927_9ACTN|nr:hypothetical protein [Nocardioides guangzhouensis]RYP84343.1 hypothetical protein EKO23_16015 [Nocardioides guangzhouensis]